MQPSQASIIHINVTDFAAAVAIAKQPSLANRPFAIAREGSRRVVLTSSHLAWKEGIRSGMPVSIAQRMLPSLLLLSPDTQATAKADAAIADIVQAYSPHLECDKGGHVYLDMQGTSRLFGPVVDSAVRIRKEIRERLGLEGAVAVASNKLVAKIGTRAIRPSGLTQIRGGEESSFLASQDISLLSGVGPAIRRLLHVAGIKQIGELASLDDQAVIAFLGKRGLALRDAARGLDTSTFHKGIGAQRSIVRKVSFAEPRLEQDALRAALVSAVEDAAMQMRSERLGTSMVGITLSWSDGRSNEATRRTKGQWLLDKELEQACWQAALQALQRRVHLLGFTLRLSALNPALQEVDLFQPEDLDRQTALQQTIDEVRRRFGPGILSHATALYHVH
ncbi:MAG: DNA polymerase [Sphaerochaeta sp.]|jgi:DNA polymerase-4|uniref:DNA polymerase Y family protein n=1 Tax=Sphaerochaeta sp. TaxID=1972642 RepID=UPI002FCB9E03